MENGFFIQLNNHNYFFIADYKIKSAKLASKVLDVLGLPNNKVSRNNIIKTGELARYTIDYLDNRPYYKIMGRNFGGVACWIDEGKTTIIDIR